jgi:hypothetical protein
MFKSLFNYVDSKFKREPYFNQPNQLSTYSSQEEMLQALGRENEPGLCSPITNLYTESKITNSPDVLSQNNKDVYISSFIKEHHQEQLRQKGKDGKHAAFVDTNTEYKIHSIPTDATLTLDINEILPTPGHTMITYPIESRKGNDPYHQVYLGKIKEDECLSFDPSLRGGERKGNCQELLNNFRDQVSTSKDNNRPPKRVTIATTSFFSTKESRSVENRSEILQSQNLNCAKS